MKLRAAHEERDVDAAPAALPRGARAVRDGKFAWVFFRGETYRVEKVVTRPGAGANAEEHSLAAPMPGKITRLIVAEGSAVTKGAPLLVLEAMKMEHEIKAPRDGTVVRIHHAAGDMVGLGDVLVEID